MHKFFTGVSVAAFVVALGVPAFAKTETVKGELVDQTCYTKDHAKNMGESHKECAVTCAKKGQTVALVTADGKMYSVLGDLAADKNAKMVPHMSHVVEITGDVAEKDGTMTITADSLKMLPKAK
jgi:predicted metal-binding protein